jgi:hypothetical protein
MYFGIMAMVANADSILFPWIIKSHSVSTLVSVVNTTAGGDPDFDELLHMEYWYKDENGTNPDGPDGINALDNNCASYNFKVLTSRDDMFTFDASGNLNDGEPLFGDTNNNADRLDLPVPAPRRAYLIVDNNTANNYAALGLNVDDTLYGEAMIIELLTGSTFEYEAYNARYVETAASQNDPVLFHDGLDSKAEVIGDTETTRTVLLPPNEYKTRFFVTPVSGLNQRVGNANARMQLCVFPSPDGGCNEGGMFDNEEGIINFSVRRNVVCTGVLGLEDLISAATLSLIEAGGLSLIPVLLTCIRLMELLITPQVMQSY